MLTPPPEEKAVTLGDTISDVKGKPLVDTLPNNLRPAKAKINLGTLGDRRTHLLVNMTDGTLQQAKAKTPLDTPNHLKPVYQYDRHVSRRLSRARSQKNMPTYREINKGKTMVDTRRPGDLVTRKAM